MTNTLHDAATLTCPLCDRPMIDSKHYRTGIFNAPHDHWTCRQHLATPLRFVLRWKGTRLVFTRCPHCV